LRPASTSALSWLSTKILPVGSVPWALTRIGSWIVVMLNVRSGEFCGQSPSSRPAYGSTADFLAAIAFSPRNGEPVCPFGVSGGRWPMFGRSSG